MLVVLSLWFGVASRSCSNFRCCKDKVTWQVGGVVQCSEKPSNAKPPKASKGIYLKPQLVRIYDLGMFRFVDFWKLCVGACASCQALSSSSGDFPLPEQEPKPKTPGRGIYCRCLKNYQYYVDVYLKYEIL